MIFTAAENGIYIVSATCDLFIETTALPQLYMVELSAEQTLSITLSCQAPLASVSIYRQNSVEPAAGDDVLALGENKVTDIGALCGEYPMVFTAGETGTYTIGASCDVLDGLFLLETPYNVELEAGQSVSIVLFCTDAQATVTLEKIRVVAVIPESDPMRAMLVGQYKINFLMSGLYVMTFTPEFEGAAVGTLTLTARNGNIVDLKYTYSYDIDTGAIIVVNPDGTDSGIFITQDSQGKLIYQDSCLKVPQPLSRSQATVVQNPTCLTLGTNSVYVSNSYSGVKLSFAATQDGRYTITAASGETNDYLIIDNEHVKLPYSFNLSAGQSIQITVSAYTDDDRIDFIIERTGDKEPEKSYVLAVGSNTIQVELAYAGGRKYTFTAAKAGTYRLTLVSGDLAVCIEVEDRGYTHKEQLELPYSFTLAEGESIALWIGTTTWKNTVVEFTIEPV